VQEELLRLGADVNARNLNGETPIFTNMNTKSIPLFLQHGADLTIRNKQGETVIDARTGRGPGWDEALRKAIAEVEHPQGPRAASCQQPYNRQSFERVPSKCFGCIGAPVIYCDCL